jgi:hypothetical protein
MAALVLLAGLVSAAPRGSAAAPREPDPAALVQAARESAVAAAAAGLPADDVAPACETLVSERVLGQGHATALAAQLASLVRRELLAALPPGPPLEVGPLRIPRQAAREILGPRPGRDRLAVLGRLRGAVPVQAGALSDDELLALLPALARAAQARPLPAEVTRPLLAVLATELPQ